MRALAISCRKPFTDLKPSAIMDAPAKRLLVMDDDTNIVDMVVSLFTPDGYVVDTALDGAAGLQLYEKESYDVVITDIFMPAMDGLEIIRKLKRNYADVKIIAMSGGGLFPENEMYPVAKGLGADVYLKKPFTYTMLRDAIASLT